MQIFQNNPRSRHIWTIDNNEWAILASGEGGVEHANISNEDLAPGNFQTANNCRVWLPSKPPAIVLYQEYTLPTNWNWLPTLLPWMEVTMVKCDSSGTSKCRHYWDHDKCPDRKVYLFGWGSTLRTWVRMYVKPSPPPACIHKGINSEVSAKNSNLGKFFCINILKCHISKMIGMQKNLIKQGIPTTLLLRSRGQSKLTLAVAKQP